MSDLFQVNRVKLLCSCGILKPITAIYFCRYCLKIRCSNCVSHEVDTHFCPNCLENMPSTEAKLKKNRCANCYDCPSCGHTLSVRAATVQVPNNEDTNTPFTRKVYYLGCTCCRWTTRDIGLEDQTIATGGWSEKEGDNYKRIQDLFEYYRALAQREKLENERKRNSKKKVSYLNLSDKYSLSSNFSSIISRRSLSSTFSIKSDSNQFLEIEPQKSLPDVDDLQNEIFTEIINLSEITSIDQRLAIPDRQPELTKELYPLHKHLLVKKSHRCRQCEHNLSKPEYNPSSIKYKIQLGAYYHIPELRILEEVELKCDVTSPLKITLRNPTPHDMTVTLLPYSHTEYFETNIEQSNLISSNEPIEKSEGSTKIFPIQPTAEVILPKSEIILSAKDDTAEYDDGECSSNYEDDINVIAFRRANKVGVNIKITPRKGSKEALFAMVVRYSYTNTVATVSDERTVTLDAPMLVNAGVISE